MLSAAWCLPNPSLVVFTQGELTAGEPSVSPYLYSRTVGRSGCGLECSRRPPLWMRAWEGLDARVRGGNANVTDLAGVASGAKSSRLAERVVCEPGVFSKLSKSG